MRTRTPSPITGLLLLMASVVAFVIALRSLS